MEILTRKETIAAVEMEISRLAQAGKNVLLQSLPFYKRYRQVMEMPEAERKNLISDKELGSFLEELRKK